MISIQKNRTTDAHDSAGKEEEEGKSTTDWESMFAQ